MKELTPRKKIQINVKTTYFRYQQYQYQMENKNFKWLISKIQQNRDFLTRLPLIQQEYLVKIYKITQLTTPVVLELYSTMQKKFYLNRKTSNEEYWYENQLRIFIWLLFGYLHIEHKQISQLSQDDWKFFTPIFNFKSTVFFQFQCFSLIKPKSRPALWSKEQTQLLELIIKQKNHKNRWNSIARELFVRSHKQFFRNPKQCRERWMNHLDPSKLHTEWSAMEDLTLLNCIKRTGKRWSIAVKELQNTRTEHMVKNRYKSLISNQAKKYPGKKQGDVENILIKKLSKIQEKQLKQAPKVQEKMIETSAKGQVEEKLVEREKIIELEQCQMKNELKQEKIKVEQYSYQYCFSNQLQEFEINSPMFIPWHIQQRNHLFSLNQDKYKSDDQFYSHISSEHQDFLPI